MLWRYLKGRIILKIFCIKGGIVKSKKQMRNIFIRRIENLLIQYYKEINFDILIAPEGNSNFATGEEYRIKAMELIELMEELELINHNEHLLLIEVYGEYFSLHKNKDCSS